MQLKFAKQTDLSPILLVNFIGTLGYSIVLPFLAVIVLKLGGNALVYGLMGATYSFFQLIGAPVLGGWSDQYGRRKILLVSEIGTLIGWLIFLLGLFMQEDNASFKSFGYVVSIPLVLIFLARALDGITGGNISIANAYLADITPKSDRKKNFGKMSAAANLGLIFGPLMAGVLGTTALGNMLPVIAAAAISLFSIWVIYTRLKDNSAKQFAAPVETDNVAKLLSQQHKECYKMKDVKENKLKKAFQLPFVPYFLVMYFLIFLSFNFFYVAFPIYVAGALHWSLFKIGIFFSVMSGALVLVQGPVLTFLSKKYSAAQLVISGGILLSIGFLLFRYESTLIIYIGVLFFALGNGLMWPSFSALLSNTGDERTQGMIQGLASSSGSLASILGLIVGALLYHSLGSNVFLLAAGLMFLIGIASVKLISIEKQIS